MRFLDRYLAKYCPFPRWGTDKTDTTPVKESAASPGEVPTKLTQPSFVSFVRDPPPEGPEFWGVTRPRSAGAVARRREACKACRPDTDCRTCQELSRRGWFAVHRSRLPRRAWPVAPEEPAGGSADVGT
jgi:hypothetical protein